MRNEAGGPADEQAFLSRQAARHTERVAVTHALVFIDHGEIERAWQLVLTTPSTVRHLRFRLSLASPELGETRPSGSPRLLQSGFAP